MLNTADSENFSQSLLDNGRRKKVMSGKAGSANIAMKGKPLIITSPLSKSKQQDLLFSQTGKLNAQLEADIMLDDSS